MQTIRDINKGLKENPLPFELEGMLYNSTFVKFELIGHVLFFKCNNVKGLQTVCHSPYKTRQILHVSSSVSSPGSMCSILGLRQTEAAALSFSE